MDPNTERFENVAAVSIPICLATSHLRWQKACDHTIYSRHVCEMPLTTTSKWQLRRPRLPSAFTIERCRRCQRTAFLFTTIHLQCRLSHYRAKLAVTRQFLFEKCYFSLFLYSFIYFSYFYSLYPSKYCCMMFHL
jgi:hypothetical protein